MELGTICLPIEILRALQFIGMIDEVECRGLLIKLVGPNDYGMTRE